MRPLARLEDEALSGAVLVDQYLPVPLGSPPVLRSR